MSTLDLSSDSELAHYLGVAPQTIATWKKRNKIPYEKVIEVSLETSKPVDYFLFGGKPTELDWGKMKFLKSFVKDTTEINLFFHIYKKLDEEFFLAEQFSAGQEQEVLSQVWGTYHAMRKQVPDLLQYTPDDLTEMADVVIADEIKKYNELIEAVNNRNK